MLRSINALCLVLLTGCAGLNQNAEPTTAPSFDEDDNRSSCFGQHICDASLSIVNDKGGIMIVVQGNYHPITAASLWVDGTSYPFHPIQPATSFAKTNRGKRLSTRLFDTNIELKEKLAAGVRVRLSAELQSYSIETILKRPGFNSTEWQNVLLSLN